MNSERVEKIARAVLYEGYLLYPYRRSAIKNRHRWNFSDRSHFQAECLALGSPQSRLDVSLRFLEIEQEAIERCVRVSDLSLDEITCRERMEGELTICATHVRDDVFRIRVQAANRGPRPHSFASAHAIISIYDGEFVSQTDPPDSLRDEAEACENIGVWPVLAGEEGARDTILASPVILSDYPQIAPESGGDLFDGTEIDEILTLRILTMTDAEKAEMRCDDRARSILERLETNPAEHLMQLHGTIREMNFEAPPVTSTRIRGIDVRKGDRVRLWPRKRADIFDTFLEGKIAIIESIEQDFEDHVHLAVVLEDDPGRDLGEMRQAGHRFFFSSSEVEPIVSQTHE